MASNGNGVAGPFGDEGNRQFVWALGPNSQGLKNAQIQAKETSFLVIARHKLKRRGKMLILIS